jgi:xanthine dehydrogenase accessory factor
MNRDMLARLRAVIAAGQSAAMVTRLSDSAQALVDERGATGELELDGATLAKVHTLIGTDTSSVLNGGLFVRAYNRPVRLLLIGAVHISQALCPIALAAGFESIVIDPRTAFAGGERFAGFRIVTEWPDRAMAELKPDRRTAVVTLTHDPKLDDPALEIALRSEAFYIGSLGSRKTHAKRLERLRAKGFNDEQLARIHAPIGLPLGGRRPAEIAVAIVAEIIRSLYGGANGPEA